VIAFVRHGQTAVNRAGRLQGRVDAPLSELGTLQARELGQALAGEPVARVLSSPLARAQATAAAIAERHECAVEVDDRLIELDYGDWDGKALGDVSAADWAAWRADPHFTPPAGESLVAVSERVAGFCHDVLSDDAFVVAVSHVSPIKAAVCVALDVDERITWQMQLGLASVTRIGIRPGGKAFLASFNETAHLTPLERG
jgi:broad specificity phosphatase PhoE